MISIKQNVAELERCHEIRKAFADCYQAAVHAAAQYAVEVDPVLTAPFREHLRDLAERIGEADDPADLDESRSIFRNELRDYRDKASRRINALRQELDQNAKTLEQILTSMSADGDDAEVQLRQHVKKLRTVAQRPEAAQVRASLESLTDGLEECVEQVRKQNQVVMAQFLVEIQLLHDRIETLQAAASLDELSRMNNRREMESRIQTAAAGATAFCLVLLKIQNHGAIERQYSSWLVNEVVAGLSKRLRNQLKADAVLGRWSASEFAAIVPIDNAGAMALTRQLTQYLSGTYVCMENGKAHRLPVQVTVGFVDPGTDRDAGRLIGRAKEFLSAA